MKLLILLLTLIPLLSNAVPPEKILPKTLVLKPLEYYSEQALAWQNEAALHRTSAESWFNYRGRIDNFERCAQIISSGCH